MDDLNSANLLSQRRGVADRECRLGLFLVLCILFAISTRGAASSLPETSGYMAAGEVVIDPSPTPFSTYVGLPRLAQPRSATEVGRN